MANEIQPMDIIDLVSDNESDSGEAIMMPTLQPSPTFTAKDSTDEDSKSNFIIILDYHDNSLDSKPEQICVQWSSETTKEGLDISLEDITMSSSSSSSSSLSIQSSDESDVTDSVHSQRTNKPIVIIEIDTSSDEVVYIGSSCSPRRKRLCKRQASSSNRDSDISSENYVSSSDDEDNKLLGTGRVVERFMPPRKRFRTLFSCSPIVQKNKSNENTEKDINQEVGAGDSETENIPTTRDMAEKDSDHNARKSLEVMAIPEGSLNGLEHVFKIIDKITHCEKAETQFSTADVVVSISVSFDNDDVRRVSVSSDSDDGSSISVSFDSDNIRRVAVSSDSDDVASNSVSSDSDDVSIISISSDSDDNDSQNEQYFKLHKCLQKMNRDRNLWKICKEDRLNIKPNQHDNNLKCTNCYEFGHLRLECKRPMKPLICHMCGEYGHLEPRCPNTICLRCGTKTKMFTQICFSCADQRRLVCSICKIRGHSFENCPDQWRRYHSTTAPNVNPNDCVKYNPHKFCSICGEYNHLAENCHSAAHYMEYAVIASTIKSHQKSYSDESVILTAIDELKL